MLHFVLGRAGVGKTAWINQLICKSIKKGDNRTGILIVPEQYTLEAERELMDALKRDVLLEVEVLSFQRLAHRLLSKGVILDERGRIMILRHIINKKEIPFKVYGKMQGKEGFLKECNNLIVELLKNNIAPTDLQNLATYSSLKNKLEDISCIYQIYLKHIAPFYKDREERYQDLAQRIQTDPYLKGALIWMYGFKGFTGQEIGVIEALLAVVSSLTIALTWDQGDIFEPTQKTYQQLCGLVSPDKVEETHLKRSLTSSNAIHHLEENLYSYPPIIYGHDVKEIIIKQGQNPQGEVEVVAKEILFLVGEKGYHFKEVVVVTNSLGEYGPLIERVFPLYGIPFFLDEKRSMMNNPIIIFILSALRVVIGHFKYQDLFTFLKSGFGPLKREDWELLENYVLTFGVEGREYYLPFTRSNSDYDVQEIDQLRIKLLEVFSPFLLVQKSEKAASYYTALLKEFLEGLKVKEEVEGWIWELKERGLSTDTYRDEISQTNEAVEEVLEMIGNLLGEEEISLKEYLTILETSFSQSKLGVIPPTIDQVLIGDLERTRSHTTRALFLIGVNDGILPSPPKVKGLLLDDERAFLREGGLPFVDGFTLAKEERFHIYCLLSKAKEYLFFTYALTDREGHPQKPSLLIKRLEYLFPLLKGEEERDPIIPISSPLATFQQLMEELQLFKKRGQFREPWGDVFLWYYREREWRERLLPLLDSLFPPLREEYLGKDQVKHLFSHPFSMGLSQLETFIKCPYAHYIQFILKAKERREYKVTPLELGSLIHGALEAFTKDLKKRGLDWRDLEKKIGDDLIEGIIEGQCKEFNQGLFYQQASNTYFIQVLKDLGKRTITTIREQLRRGEYRVAYYELLFSKNGHLPPLHIPLPTGQILELEGRIDRLDTWEEKGSLYVRIIDYKTGLRSFSLGEAYLGLQIQLPLYLAAVLEGGHRLFKGDVRAAGLFYYRIHDPILDADMIGGDVEEELLKELRLDGLLIGQGEVLLSHDTTIEEKESSFVVPLKLNKGGEPSKGSNVLREEELKLLLNHLIDTIGKIGEDLLKGQVAVRPVRVNRDRKTIPCHYCDYTSICAFDPYSHRYRDVEKKKKEDILRELKGD